MRTRLSRSCQRECWRLMIMNWEIAMREEFLRALLVREHAVAISTVCHPKAANMGRILRSDPCQPSEDGKRGLRRM
jgi:hypothetical protein